MDLNLTLLAGTLLVLVLFALLLGHLAENRGLSRSAWAIVGLVPVLNVLGLIFLLFKPTVNSGARP